MKHQLLRQSFRWYGPADPICLGNIRQAGATDIVSALHQIPNGAVWPKEAIQQRIDEVAAAGLRWSVVESLPVSEDIKTRTGSFEQHLDNYKKSLRNLGGCGIQVVTYNFMPILDWTRTDLDFQLAEGYTTLRFDKTEIAVFDLFLLERPSAIQDYSDAEIEGAKQRFATMDAAKCQQLMDNILKGLPGSEEGYTMEEFRAMLQTYEAIDHHQLRAHLLLFLEEILPVAASYGIKMVIHPDDPPFDIFGLPRILRTASDARAIFSALPSLSNGLCFCTGSFGVRPDNDLAAMAAEFADRTHFLHLRSTQRDGEGNFYEANHLDGDANIPEVLKVFIEENQKRAVPIPFRPDHGYRMLDDLSRPANPGYSLIGRLKGLAEIRGLERGILAMK